MSTRFPRVSVDYVKNPHAGCKIQTKIAVTKPKIIPEAVFVKECKNAASNNVLAAGIRETAPKLAAQGR